MSYCKNCGNEVHQQSIMCPHCGVRSSEDAGGFGWGLLGCCVPFVGLILFLMWYDTKPKSAKAAGIGALIRVIFSIVMGILFYFTFVLAIGASV